MQLTLPSRVTCAKLFGVGATVGPLVDSLHNQVLLEYRMAPVEWAHLCSSWTIPPLLGFAYVVLGGILPRLFQAGLAFTGLEPVESSADPVNQTTLRNKAVLAVATTSLIIKLSELLETNQFLSWLSADQQVVLLLMVALAQWLWLDGTLAALLVASVTSIGGPLSELPFVANGVWEYLPSAADYLPLESFADNGLLVQLLGPDYASLALSSITGPCYFAVTMDAIALGRWLDASEDDEDAALDGN